MTDYTELVKDLLHCATSSEACTSCNRKNERYCQDNLHTESADAIEKLQGTLFLMKKTAEFVAEKVPKWTPVTELPPEGETYGDTTFSVEVLGTEGFTYRKAYYNFKYKVWLDGNEEQEWPSITHWMPIPEPPKKECQ